MTDFTCVQCLSAPGTRAVPNAEGDAEAWCEPCLNSWVGDCLLDMFNAGELRLAPDGHSFETTEILDARRRYERGEDR